MTTETTSPSRPRSAAEGLIERLTTLVAKDDRGALAQLRRSAGKIPGEAEGVFRYVVPFVPDRPPDEWIETCRYLIAGLFALHPPQRQPNGTVTPMPDESLGAAFNRMAPHNADNRESVERRFSQLLVADEYELPERLRQAISLLRGAGQPVPVGWRRLLADLERWRRSERRVQRQWARDFWRLPEPERDDGEPPDAANPNT